MFKNSLFFENVDFNIIKEYQNKLFDEYNSKKIGYYHLPSASQDLISKIEAFGKEKNYKKIVVLGVGGSALGAKAISSMIIATKDKSAPKLDFFENTDPVTISHKLSKTNFNETLFLIISKSGFTIETVSITKIILDFFKKDITKENFAVITDFGSPLDNFAKKYNLQTFYIYENVGGRFSVLSAVGIVPLLLSGYDVKALLDGAKKCEEEIFKNKNETIFQKAYMYCFSKDISINVLFSYSDAFREFNDWYIQLWAESLGKINRLGKRVGLTPVGLIGSIDQHSFLQLIVQGVKNKSVTFLKVEDFDTKLKIPDISLPFLEKSDLTREINMGEFLNEQCFSTMQSVINEGITVDEINIKKLDAYHAGYLIYYYEILTSICAIMLEVDAYNQPGVEIGKKILLNKLGKNFSA